MFSSNSQNAYPHSNGWNNQSSYNRGGQSSFGGNDDFSVSITEHIATLSEWSNPRVNNGSVNTKEINLVSWNGRDPSLDIRNWFTTNESGEKRPGKGISLKPDEAHALYLVLAERYGDQSADNQASSEAEE